MENPNLRGLSRIYLYIGRIGSPRKEHNVNTIMRQNVKDPKEPEARAKKCSQKYVIENVSRLVKVRRTQRKTQRRKGT